MKVRQLVISRKTEKQYKTSLLIITLPDSTVNNIYHFNDINAEYWSNKKLRYTLLEGWGDDNCM